MAFIKTTNVVMDDCEQIKKITRNIQCPYCKTFLKGVPKYITAMKCWYCKKEFRIQQDKSKFGIEMPKKVRRYLGKFEKV